MSETSRGSVELGELEVLIVDCQTTGASPAHGVVLEIGWAVARAEQAGVQGLESHWIVLPEGQRVSAQVRQLTGYEDGFAANALVAPRAWEQLRAARRGAERIPTAIHFAQFELAFLRDWAQRFEPQREFPLDAVCVHAIARRLYPDLPRRSLRALAGYLGHGVPQSRQCVAHVEATAFIWQKQVAELASLGIRTWPALEQWLAEPEPARPRAKQRRYPLAAARYRALPDAPGVYRLLRSNGELLYVGKAASLRKRVASHFSSRFSRTERALEMLTQVHDLQVTRCPSALEAALLENELIKALEPPYNVSLVVTDGRVWFCDGALAAVSSRPDALYRRGPLPSAYSVRGLGAIERLCAGAPPALELRARAAGTRERWAPDEAVFAEGFRLFAERYAISVPLEGARRALSCVARRLLGAAVVQEVAPQEAAEPAAESESSAWHWDPERVLRHLERSVAHGYQLLQRARWLCLIRDSRIVFREPGSSSPRFLQLKAARLLEAGDAGSESAPADALALPPLLERQAAFDRTDYDRLRTLTTELARVLRDGGSAEVRIGKNHWLRGERLAALLRWV